MSERNRQRVMGVLPAAGTASRLGRLPCSKELLPVDHRVVGGLACGGPRVAAQFLVDGFREAGAESAVIVLREGKWDIPTYFGDGSDHGIRFAYVLAEHPFGVPYSVDAAVGLVRDSVVLFGFPDILSEPLDALSILLDDLYGHEDDLVLGLFRANSPQKMDMVRLDPSGAFAGLEIKPASTDLTYTWILAAWRPRFTSFLHEWVRKSLEEQPDGPEVGGREPYLGDVVVAAWDSGFNVGTRVFETGSYIDVGTPDELRKAVHRYSRVADESETGACE